MINLTVQETVENVNLTVDETQENVTLNITTQPQTINLTISDNATVVIPPDFEQRVTDLENDKIGINDLINGGIIM